MTSSARRFALLSLLSLPSLTVISACGGSPARPMVKAAPASDAQKPPTPEIVVVPMTLVAHFDHEAKIMDVLDLRADGAILFQGKTVAHVAGRTIVDEAGATLVGFDVEGKLVGFGKKIADITFDADDTLTAAHANRTEKVAIAADGRVVAFQNGVEKKSDDVYFLSPAPTGASRRTGIFLMATMSILAEKKQIAID